MNVHEIARVKRVTVNARLVTPPGVSPILGGVSLLCRTAFPNTESSVVNLYYDSQAWRADGLFVKSSDGVVNIVAAPLENKID
jgi:hypothetical protein